MEGALVSLAVKAGLDPDRVRRELPRTDEIPFDAAHRFMATLHHSHDDGAFIARQGRAGARARDVLTQRGADGGAARPGYWHEAVTALARRGPARAGVRRRGRAAGKQDLDFADVDDGATLLGLVGLIDPPREEAIDAIASAAPPASA